MGEHSGVVGPQTRLRNELTGTTTDVAVNNAMLTASGTRRHWLRAELGRFSGERARLHALVLARSGFWLSAYVERAWEPAASDRATAASGRLSMLDAIEGVLGKASCRQYIVSTPLCAVARCCDGFTVDGSTASFGPLHAALGVSVCIVSVLGKTRSSKERLKL